MGVRSAAASLALAALAPAAAGPARATPEDDVRATAVAFLEATARQDGPALCGAMTAELQARVGSGERGDCFAAFEADRRAQRARWDRLARGRLETAHVLSVGEQETPILMRLAVEAGAWRVADLFISTLPVATPPLRRS